ncbi:MAG: malate dehydrogenase [Candidatus Omnitrophica bacterium]|nr:malate dehydrogenase [Candidatus Omnitrophota bacterium]
MEKTKISIIGAGNVGAQTAMRILELDLADVVLLDIQEDLAKAKAFDLTDAGAIMGYRAKVTATGDYANIKDSDIVIITAGFTRKPGMAREELLEKNAQVIKEAVSGIKEYAKNSIIIVVTNPLDILTHLTLKLSGFSSTRVMGMAGVLDSARFSVQLADFIKTPPRDIKSVVLGSHSDKMLLLSRFCRYKKKGIINILRTEDLKTAEERTRRRGSEIVGLLKGGSAFFAPSAGVMRMVEAIVKDKKEIMPVCCYLDGYYGLKDVTLGNLARIGRKGIEEIIELDLTFEEKKLLQEQAEEIRFSIQKLSI